MFNKFGGTVYFLKMSFVQIYNEQIYDLINNNEKRNLKLDSTGGLCIANVKEARISSLKEADYYLSMGIHSRKMCQTTLNVESSRSHSVFTLKLFEKNLETNEVNFLEKYSIVDLAGSERNKRTNTQFDDLKDASYINKSLCILGRCLNDIQWNQRHSGQNQRIVPFRESKLTRIFQDLMEKGKVVMIVNANPSLNDLDETCAVLKYSAVAKQIETGCRYNQTTPKSKKLLFPNQSSLVSPQSVKLELKENTKKLLLKSEREISELKENFAKDMKEKDKYYLNLVLTLETQIEDLKEENFLLKKNQLDFDSTCDRLILSNQTKEAEIERLKKYLDRENYRFQQENEELERQFQIELFETNCLHRSHLAEKDEEIQFLKSQLEQKQFDMLSPKKKKILQNVPMNLLTPQKDESESLYEKWTSNKKNQQKSTQKNKENESKKLLFK